MISDSIETNRYQFINRKWRFFKDWMKKVNKCYFIKNLKIDEVNKVFTYSKVYRVGTMKFDGDLVYEGTWEEEMIDEETIKITAYVRQIDQKRKV